MNNNETGLSKKDKFAYRFALISMGICVFGAAYNLWMAFQAALQAKIEFYVPVGFLIILLVFIALFLAFLRLRRKGVPFGRRGLW